MSKLKMTADLLGKLESGVQSYKQREKLLDELIDQNFIKEEVIS